MVDHVRVLLMNESAAVLSGKDVPWATDSSFTKVSLPPNTVGFHGLIFANATSIGERVARIDDLAPFVFDKELSWGLSLMDGRKSVPDVAPAKTVFSFCRRMDGGSMIDVNGCVSGRQAQSLFYEVPSLGTPIQRLVESLKQVFLSSAETAKKFSAAMIAYVLQLESARIKSAG